MNRSIPRFFLLLAAVWVSTGILYGQVPPNDNCSTPVTVAVNNGGYGLGTFISSTVNASTATLQAGETFPSYITNRDRSVWFKFTLPTTRSANICLKRVSAINYDNFCAFTVYKDNGTCPPLQSQTIIGMPGQNQATCSQNLCLTAGTYYVQASINNSVPVSPAVQFYVQIDLGPPSVSNSNYDLGSQASNSGIVTSTISVPVGFTTGCQSIDSAAEICTALPNNGAQHTQSTWHTFTTDNFVDYIGIFMQTMYSTNTPVGYRLYQGNVATTALSSLPLIDACRVIRFTGSNAAQVEHVCDLLPNATYSIQLLFPQTFSDSVLLTIRQLGDGPTRSPVPVISQLDPATKLGILTPTLPGTITQVTDHFACNGRLSLPANQCAPSNPAAGYLFRGHTYDMCSWYTFTTTSYTNILIDARVPNSPIPICLPVYVRFYSDAITSNCNSVTHLIAGFSSTYSTKCLPPGTYSFQVLGSSGMNNIWDDCNSQFGRQVNISVTCTQTDQDNQFNLINQSAYNGINNMLALQNNVLYTSAADKFGCDSTLLPGVSNLCDTGIVRAMYREFNIPASTSSGILTVSNLTLTAQGGRGLDYMLLQGNAATLSQAQGGHDYGSSISGLQPVGPCIDVSNSDYLNLHVTRLCITPGDHTFVSLGNAPDVGISDQPKFKVDNVVTIYNSPANAEVMDTLSTNNTITSHVDHFSCYDNAVSPCGAAFTKAIYREFYVADTTPITIFGAGDSGHYIGTYSLYHGRATSIDSAVNTGYTQWQCAQSITTVHCEKLLPGWYTLITYGRGPSYASQYYPNGDAGNIGDSSKVTITTNAPADSNALYDRPYKACVVNGGAPLTWYTGQNPAFSTIPPQYPYHNRTYTLCTEQFRCKNDLPFSDHPVDPCVDSSTLTTAGPYNRVAYYTFNIAKEAYVVIYGLPSTSMAKVYPFNVRTDSLRMLTEQPIQPCIKGNYFIQLCRLQPGDYTLAVFVGDNMVDRSLSPSLYIDSVALSRFDHAASAYDFGVITNAPNFIGGKPGDVNPYNPARQPSHDFFYCTTGSHPSDPNAARCYVFDYGIDNNHIYPQAVNNPMYLNGESPFDARRNLWYTFVLQGKGHCDVRVTNPNTAGAVYPYAVYKSDVTPGNIPFSTLQATGGIDSTVANGLSTVVSNYIPVTCAHLQQVSFDLCQNAQSSTRYYILVDKDFNSWVDQQVEVAIRFDSVSVKYNHYSEANVINGLGQTDPPYTANNLGVGTYAGAPCRLLCETIDPTDQNSCGGTTIWYKFTTLRTGSVRVGIRTDSNTVVNFNPQDILLMKQDPNFPNDSTVHGIPAQTLTAVTSGTDHFGETCLTPGTYYVMITGCHYITQIVTPVVQIVGDQGDSCTTAIAGTISGAGNFTLTANVTCHTMGGNFGEDGSDTTCMLGPQGYKSTWFKVDITDPFHKYDVAYSLTAGISPSTSQIPYRVLSGTCDSMVVDPTACGAINTGFSVTCKPAASYYIQVFTPVASVGTVTLHISSGFTHDPNCNPIPVNFSYVSTCDNDSVHFTNLSFNRSSFLYHWDLGFGGVTSDQFEPVIVFPRAASDRIYNVKLTVTDTIFNNSSDTTIQVLVPNTSQYALGNDTILCAGQPLTLHPTGLTGQYVWQDSSTATNYSPTSSGIYWVATTINSHCRDSILVTFNPLPVVSLAADSFSICQGDTTFLDAGSTGSTYQWSNGYTLQILPATQQQVYSVTVTNQYGCKASDSAAVLLDPLPPQFIGTAQTICAHDSALLTATGGISYLWNNGSTNNSITVSPAISNQYSVKVTNADGCFVYDSLMVIVNQWSYNNRNVRICESDSFFAGGGFQHSAGLYYDTLTAANGCDSVVTTNLLLDSTAQTIIDTGICAGQTYYAAHALQNSNGVYMDTLQSIAGCDSIVITTLTVRPLPVINISTDTVICAGSGVYLIATGGTTYIWSDGGAHATDTVSPIHSERYIVTVDDGYCVAADSVNVVVNQLAYTSLAIVICQGDSFYASGGFQNLTGTYYDTLMTVNGCDSIITTQLTVNTVGLTTIDTSICAGQSYFAANQLQTATGIFTDTLNGVNGCDSIITTNLTVLPLPVITISADTTICEKSSVMLIASGGINYLWSDGNSGTMDTVRPTLTTIYRVTVNDGNCIDTDSVSVSVEPQPTISINGDTLFCGTDSVMLTAVGTGSFEWGNTDTSQSIYVMQADEYSVTITDNFGCKNADTAYLNNYPAISVRIDTIEPLCNGSANGVLTAVVNGGSNAGYAWQWKDAAGNIIGTSDPLNGVTAGSYFLNVADAHGCTANDSVTLSQPDSLKILDVSSIDISCYGYKDGTMTASATGGTVPVSYSIDGGITYQPTSTFTELSMGSYQVWVKDANGCITRYTNAIQIAEPPAISVHINANGPDTLSFGQTIQLLSNYNAQAKFPIMWTWAPDNTLDHNNTPNVTASPLQTTTYTLMIEDSNQCFATDTFTVYVNSGKAFFVPNVFTPNADGNNDVFRVYALGVRTFSCRIFDRWGEKVFEYENINDGWDGIYKGKPAPPGVYAYIVILSYDDGDTHRSKGSFTLLK